jgi:hypothetical protein
MNSLNAIKSCLTLYLWYMEQTNERCKQPYKAIENGKMTQKATTISGGSTDIGFFENKGDLIP